MTSLSRRLLLRRAAASHDVSFRMRVKIVSRIVSCRMRIAEYNARHHTRCTRCQKSRTQSVRGLVALVHSKLEPRTGTDPNCLFHRSPEDGQYIFRELFFTHTLLLLYTFGRGSEMPDNLTDYGIGPIHSCTIRLSVCWTDTCSSLKSLSCASGCAPFMTET